MAAFNYIEFSGTCPMCQATGVLLTQCHIASSFGGDATGRFCHRTYRLNDVMAWWPKDHKDWRQWLRSATRVVNSDGGVVQECCYVDCGSCAAELYAVVQFELIAPEFAHVSATSVIQIGLENDWPEEHRYSIEK